MFDRSYAENILPTKLEEYMKEFENDMKLGVDNINEKTLLRASIAAKWCRFGYEEEQYKKKLLESLDEMKERLSKKLYEKRKEELVNQTIKENLIKLDVEKKLKMTSQYKEVSEALKMQDDVIRFIMEAKLIISQFGYDLKNAIEILKLENI